MPERLIYDRAMPAIRRAALAGALLVLLAVPSAHATLPKFADKTIVVGKSIGGVKLGMGAAAAKKAWGGAKGCALFGSASCIYRPAGSTQSSAGEGSFGFPGGKVTSVYIAAPLGAKGYLYKPPLSTPKTDKGIGIGSKLAAAKKAYPKATVSGTFMTITGKGGVSTTFEFYGDDKRCHRVSISRET